ncbi:MMS19 nucleotide excision repair protein homolog isoform X1 [Drosophila guanche]|uniref:MMS19 nucleotide excision repair protein n=2 Tax=Drosophila guanche TaxID=7266 RepID=A0A3B0JR22_DROGU|nr:MMS19 nucleotide excision repair protein homolog isoform X1 [Drosophila guanche]SPP84614.1 blast:MMS19 nucleotide excision repair protein homolog [Drosophila guanche]
MTTPTRATLEKALKSDAKLQKEATQVAKDLTAGVYDISLLAEELGFALSSPDMEQRVAGTNLLSAVLCALPTDLLSAEQLEFLTTFYTDRLRDHHNVMPAIIDGIDAMVHMKALPAGNVPLILQAFFQHTTCQSQTRGDRTKLFNIFKYLTLTFKEELTTMAGDFVYGLINSIDGERDPRNLEIIFSFMPDFMANYPLLHLAEEMFEIFACYFPIDFNPSKQDPTAITRDQLAAKLTNCLVANNEFAEWTVVLAVEKLESELLVAKLDSIELLHQAAVKFPPSVLEPHFDQIWQALKAETFPGADNEDILKASLKALGALLERAAHVPSISHSYQTSVLGVVLPQLSDVNQRLFHPATAIALVCVAGDAPFAADKILNSFLLKLQATDLGTSPPDQRIKIYQIVAQVYKLTALRDSLQKLDTTISVALQDDVIAALRLCEREDFDAKQEDLELQKAALSVLNECAPVLSEAQRALVYKALVQLISHPTIDLDFTVLTVGLGALQPVELQANFIDISIRNFEIFSNFIKRKIYSNLLPLLPQMAFTQRILDLVMTQMFKEGNPEPVRLLALEALNTLLTQEDQRFIVDLQQQSNLLHKLIELAQQTEDLTLQSLEQIAGALSRIIQQLPLSEQSAIISEYLPGLQLQKSADLYIAKGLLGYLHKDISLDDHFERLLSDLTQLSLSTENEQLRVIAHHLLCSLVNKMQNSTENRGKVKQITEQLKKAIKAGDVRAVEILAWVGKGLVVAGFDEAADIVGDLSDLLKHPTLSTAAALGFDIIAAEYPELDLPVVKFLYKQKFFHTIMGKMGNKLADYCVHHLKAFVYVLKATPQAVIKLNIEQLGPLLFRSLEEHNEAQSLCIALGICESFVQQQDAYFQAHLGHLIPSCLELSKYKAQHTMQVRIAALQLLYDITKYPTFALLPHKVDVTLALAAALDDPKRLVRNTAVQARNAWYLVGAANED